MDYQKIKKDITEIAEISNTVPEHFREKCFEILLMDFLNSKKTITLVKDDSTPSPLTSTLKLPSNVLAFMRRNDVSQEEIGAVVMFDGTDFHFIKEPAHKNARKGQNEWALLIALRNGITNNNLSSDPEAVRSLVQDKGYYDSANFAKNFKITKYAKYFRNSLEPHGSAQSLTKEGEVALAKLIKSLAG